MSKSSIIRVIAVVAVSAVVLLSPPVRAQEANLDLKARTYFAAGKYQQALDIYADLYARTLHPTYLRNIGRCYQNMGEPEKAITSFREYLRKAKNVDPTSRSEVQGYIAEMEELERSSQPPSPPAPKASPPPAASAPPPAVAPVKLDAPPPQEDDASPTLVRTAASTPERASPEDQPSPIYVRWWFWTAVGVVVAGGVVTALALSSAGPQAPSAQTTFGTMEPHR